MTISYSLGIDPGAINCGMAIVACNEGGKLSLFTSATLNPSELGFNESIHSIANSGFGTVLLPFSSVVIERFVPYQGKFSSVAEDITMLIGGLRHGFRDSEVLLYRAIEWKTELVKTLVKLKGFDNPSLSLDKKFSIAAANACLDNNERKFNGDHEADAICLASLPFLRAQLAARKQSST